MSKQKTLDKYQSKELLMNISSFLYRRLAPWITCGFSLPEENGKITLQNKYEIASFQDVFCHPFYWQVFQWLENPPELIVDCGAHCGHFTVLSEICLRSKFINSKARYILIEPNPFLIPVIKKNLKDANLETRSDIKQGLLGRFNADNGTLWINSKNFLQTGLSPSKDSRPYEVGYFDLSNFLKDKKIDLMKIDIEGGEYDFIEANLDILDRTNLLFMELHQVAGQSQSKLLKQLQSVGFHQVIKPALANGQQLLIFKKNK